MHTPVNLQLSECSQLFISEHNSALLISTIVRRGDSTMDQLTTSMYQPCHTFPLASEILSSFYIFSSSLSFSFKNSSHFVVCYLISSCLDLHKSCSSLSKISWQRCLASFKWSWTFFIRLANSLHSGILFWISFTIFKASASLNTCLSFLFVRIICKKETFCWSN